MPRNWLTTRVWLLVFILVISPVGAPVYAQGAAVVRVDPAALTVQVNDPVNIQVKVDNIANLTAFELHLSFNPGVLEVTGLTNGGFVAADFTAQNTYDNAAGTIDYAIAQMNRPPAQGSGTLLTIALRAKAGGSSTVTTRPTQAAPSGLLLSDQNGTAIQASWVPGSVNVGTTTIPTSTPTSTPTLASGATSTPTSTPTQSSSNTSTPTSTPTLASGATSTPTSTPTQSSSNTNTPTSTPTPTASPSTPPATLGIHVVRFGEWIYCIGRAYQVSPKAIIQVNHLWWPYIIFPSQQLVIPNIPWVNVTAGRVCQAQFTVPVPTPSSTSTSISPTVTPIPTSSVPPPTVTLIPPTSVPPSACRAVYVVRRGDNLYRIALRYGTTYTELARTNQISNPRLIYPGQQLCIP